MLAMLRDSLAMGAEKVVGPWRPIAADNVDLSPGPAELLHQFVKYVKLPWVIDDHVAGAVIAQKVVEHL